MRINYPSQAELQEVFEYVDGELWRKAYMDAYGRSLPRKFIKNISNTPNGYCQIRFKDKKLFYHTIVLILYSGDAIKGCMVDHIDGNRLNNHPTNLRWVSNRENQQNQQTHRKGKLPGCCFHRHVKKWQAYMGFKGKRKHIGYFNTELEAHTAYMAAVEQIEKESVV